MSLDSRISALKEAMPSIIKSMEKPFLNEILPYFESQFEDRGTDFKGFVSGKNLGIRSGKLIKSFYAKAYNEGFDVGTNSIYASVHENGGFIASKGRMHRYFWKKYFETKQDYFKYIALSVMKKGGVYIPRRPFFSKAVQDIADNKAQISKQISQELISRIIKAWDNG